MKCICEWGTGEAGEPVLKERMSRCLVHGDDPHDQQYGMLEDFNTVIDELETEIWGAIHETSGSQEIARLADDLQAIARVRRLVREIVDPRD